MVKDLIIHSNANKAQIALLENNTLVELHSEVSNNQCAVGDIFLGKVKKINPGLNACFVDIGTEKDAFLHYTDLGPMLNSVTKFTRAAQNGSIKSGNLSKFVIEPTILKSGKIDKVLQKKEFLLVQVIKEPISSKGPRLTTDISLAGRYMVFTPFANGVSISKKIINPDERKRLSKIVEQIKEPNCSIIIRTAAENIATEELLKDWNDLKNKWDQVQKNLHNQHSPLKVLSELDKTSSILRDLLSNDFNKIVIDDTQYFNEIKEYVRKIKPDKVNILENHRSNTPIFEQYGITKQIKSSFGQTANISGGVYLVIEHTEALTVIDVNSGYKVMNTDQESAALKVNLEAVPEIARQLRLRDIGGIIVIDFIDMKNAENRKMVFDKMDQEMKSDVAKKTILPISKFGLMQITRERTRPAVKIKTSETCPSCNGSGKIESTILIEDQIESDIDFIISRQNPDKIYLKVNPIIHAFLTKGFINKRIKWMWHYKKKIIIKADQNLAITQYKFFDENSGEIKLD